MKETIYIGIDIAKYKHDFCIISSTGEVIVQNNSFDCLLRFPPKELFD